jgi:prepilin-type N-terminal cleavage/methylation domain-containing protein
MSEAPERLRFRRLRFGEAAEAGFTLIELLVVLLIIGTLLAIVIPTFLTTAKTANNTAAPANLLYTSGNQSHFGVCGATGVSTITAIDTGLTFVTGKGSTKENTVSINSSGAAGRHSPGTTDCWITVYRMQRSRLKPTPPAPQASRPAPVTE